MADPVFVRAGEGRQVEVLGDGVTIKLDGARTGAPFVVVRLATPPGGGPPPHVHTNEDETFVVLDGTLSFFFEGAWTDIGPGGTVFLPRGRAHTFRNNTSTTVHSMVFATPSGLERFFEETAAAFPPGTPLDEARLIAISAKHGITYPKIAAPT